MRWFSLILTFGGAISALVAWFAFQNMEGVVISVVIAIVGLWFKPPRD